MKSNKLKGKWNMTNISFLQAVGSLPGDADPKEHILNST
jgi:hypothetical protein